MKMSEKSNNDKAIEDLIRKLFDSMSKVKRTVPDKRFEKFILDRFNQKMEGQ